MKTYQKLAGGLLFAFIAILGAAQASKGTTVNVPFKFWIETRELPAGDYLIDRVDGPDVLLLHSKDQKYIQQVFLLPVRGSVEASDPKLVFVERNGKYYLTEFWGAQGKRILTAEYGVPARKEDNRREVPIQE